MCRWTRGRLLVGADVGGAKINSATRAGQNRLRVPFKAPRQTSQLTRLKAKHHLVSSPRLDLSYFRAYLIYIRVATGKVGAGSLRNLVQGLSAWQIPTFFYPESSPPVGRDKMRRSLHVTSTSSTSPSQQVCGASLIPKSIVGVVAGRGQSKTLVYCSSAVEFPFPLHSSFFLRELRGFLSLPDPTYRVLKSLVVELYCTAC